MIEKSDSKRVSLATTSILGRPPRRLSENREPAVEKSFIVCLAL
ncbi:MAG: hypothetical protein V3V31_03305 [Methylococcales bacterium]